jgi:hypothetical protein
MVVERISRSLGDESASFVILNGVTANILSAI